MPPTTQLVTRLLPLLVKQVPRLWPLLLETKNRELVAKYAKGLADRSPGRRLATKIDLTADLAASMAERASTTEEAERARLWQKRASAMRDRLALPVTTDRKGHRATLSADLQALHDEMSAALREGEPTTGH